jgi:signal peptidase I
MYPSLRPGERVLFDRLAYRSGAPRQGDVVLARHPARPGVRFIKRISQPLDEVTFQEGDYWLLGDNRDASTDSRELGPFRREDILARAWFVYWPPDSVRRIRRDPPSD